MWIYKIWAARDSEAAGCEERRTSVDTAVLDAMRRRRSIRKFKDQDVGDEAVETLLEMAMYAPSRLNKRPWHFLVVRNPEVRRRIARELHVHSFLEGAPLLIAVAAKPEVSPTWLMDVSAAIQNMLLAAEAQGLGAVWVGAPGTVEWEPVETVLREMLAIPEEVRVVSLVAVGYPAQEVAPHDKDLHFDRTRVHYERWGNLRGLDMQDLQEEYLQHVRGKRGEAPKSVALEKEEDLAMAEAEEKIRVAPEVCAFVDDDHLTLTLEISLPGVEKDSINLRMHADSFALSAPRQGTNIEYVAAMAFCCPVKPEEAEAVYENGLLRVVVPFKDLMEDAVKIPVK
jgi:nitroreductase/HSP20 family molecular chaperone IbpA